MEKKQLKVIIYEPYLRTYRSYIEYVVDMEINVNGEQHKHEYTSYVSVEEAVDRAEEHKEVILQAGATLDAWLAAHGETDGD